MLDYYGRDFFVRGIAAAKAGSRDEARSLLERALNTGPPIEDRIQAYRYLAQLSDDPQAKRRYVERILAVDPADGEARRDLAILDGRLDPKDVVDPSDLPAPSPGTTSVEGRQFVCPRCGGPLVYSPDGRRLVCESCDSNEPVGGPGAANDPDRHDFATAMWTAKGHRAPVATQSFTCKSCGASFVLPPRLLSLTCPYCASVYVIEQLETRELLPPDVLIPFAVTETDALTASRDHLAREGVEGRIIAARGLYQPVWIFSFFGDVMWRGVVETRSGQWNLSEVSGEHPVVDCVVWTPAWRTSPAQATVLREFDLSRTVSYDESCLADWPAQTYEVSLEDASFEARQSMRALLEPEVRESVDDGVRGLSLHFARVGIDWFKLALVPIWIVDVESDGSRAIALVNGQTGTIVTDAPPHGLRGLLQRLLGE